MTNAGFATRLKLAGHRLEVRREPSGWRHYLDGRPVHCGTRLELLVMPYKWHRDEDGEDRRVRAGDDVVLPGRYEWACDDDDEPPMFFLDMLEELAGWGIGHVELPKNARLRWPVDA